MDIEVNNLCKRYKDYTVFDGFSHVFYGGKINFLMGPSGCGKTSLIRIIMGLEGYEAGSVTPILSSRVSYVGQADSLLENMSIYNNIKLVNDSISENDLKSEMKKIGLDMSIRKRVRDLSGGQKRRVAILRASLYESDIFIMDEPFKGLDENNKKIVMDYIIDKTKSAIIVSHDESEYRYFRKKLKDNVFLKCMD